MTPEQKAKMAAGREAAKAKKAQAVQPDSQMASPPSEMRAGNQLSEPGTSVVTEKDFQAFRDEINGRIDKLANVIQLFMEVNGPPPDAPADAPEASAPVKTEEETAPRPKTMTSPVKRSSFKLEDAYPEWREIVDAILGEDFEAVAENSGAGQFRLILTLPPRLDRRKGEEKLAAPRDISVGLVRTGTDLKDVHTTCSVVRKNIEKTYPEAFSHKPMISLTQQPA